MIVPIGLERERGAPSLHLASVKVGTELGKPWLLGGDQLLGRKVSPYLSLKFPMAFLDGMG